MADFYHAIGNDRAAEDLYRRAAEILSATLGRENTVTSAVTSRRVEMLDALGRHTDARRVAMSFQ
jgi:hypothetical protein